MKLIAAGVTNISLLYEFPLGKERENRISGGMLLEATPSLGPNLLFGLPSLVYVSMYRCAIYYLYRKNVTL